MKSVSSDKEMDKVLEACMKEIIRITKSGKTPVVEKNSMKYMIPMVENTMKGNLGTEESLKNVYIVLDRLMASGLVSRKKIEKITEWHDFYSTKVKAMGGKENLSHVDSLLRRNGPGDYESAFQILASRIINGYEDGMERYIPTALDILSHGSEDATVHVAQFMYYAMLFKKELFQFYREYIRELLKSRNAVVRGIAVMCCSVAGDPSMLKDLAVINRDRESIDIRMFHIAEHKIRFPHHDNSASLGGMAEEAIHEIISRSRDKTLYLKNSVTVNFPESVRVGEEFLFTIHILPIMNFTNLIMNMTSLEDSLSIRGGNMISIPALSAGDPAVYNVQAICAVQGKIKGSIKISAENGQSASFNVECYSEDKPQAIQPQLPENDTTRETQEKIQHPMEIIRMKIETGQVRKVTSALDELINYAGSDSSLRDRISALSIMLSLKGTEKISNSEMENALSLLESVKGSLQRQ